MSDIFDTAVGAMSGIVGTIGGLGLMGAMIAIGLVLAVATCCGCSFLLMLGNGGG